MTADGGMGDEDFISQGRDELVAPKGEFGGDARRRAGERGQNQQTTGGQGLLQSEGTRWGKARAGHIIVGCAPRSRICRHSFSTGEWKPLMTQRPASRHLAA